MTPGRVIGQAYIDEFVDTSRPRQSRVQQVGTVGSPNQKDSIGSIEPVQLNQQFVQRRVLLGVLRRIRPLLPNRIQLIHEDDTRCILFSKFKQLANPRRTDPDIFLLKLRPGYRNKPHLNFTTETLGQERLAIPGRTFEQDTARDSDIILGILLGVGQKVGTLHELLLDQVVSTHLRKRRGAASHLKVFRLFRCLRPFCILGFSNLDFDLKFLFIFFLLESMKKKVRVRLETKTGQTFDGLAFLFQQVFQHLFVTVDLVVNPPKIFLVLWIVVGSQKGSTWSPRTQKGSTRTPRTQKGSSRTHKGLDLSKQQKDNQHSFYFLEVFISYSVRLHFVYPYMDLIRA